MKTPIIISNEKIELKTGSPKFSKDDTKIAFLSTTRPNVQTDYLHFEIYNILTNKINIIPSSIVNVNPLEFIWINDRKIYFTSEYNGVQKISVLNITNINNPSYTQLCLNDPFTSYMLPVYALKSNSIPLILKSAYNQPETINYLNNDEDEILNLNMNFTEKYELTYHKRIKMSNEYLGWIFKPINFKENKTYPLVLIIHGGPHDSHISTWSHFHNPQIYTNMGFSVLLLNIHGSSGVSENFQDSVRDNWGGTPYDDIITGINYAINNFNYIDKNNICVIGFDYGGFMINWMEGQKKNKNFTFKCFINNGGIFNTLNMFYSTDVTWFVKGEYCNRNNIKCNPFDDDETRKNIYKYSPEKYVKNWDIPMLVIHGGNDYRISLSESLSTFTALKLNNISSKFIYFNLENKSIKNPSNIIKWYDEVLNWLKKYTNN